MTRFVPISVPMTPPPPRNVDRLWPRENLEDLLRELHRAREQRDHAHATLEAAHAAVSAAAKLQITWLQRVSTLERELNAYVDRGLF